ncbi:MAG: hypothetical protein QXE91_02390 [Thermofilaceae archaeon]
MCRGVLRLRIPLRAGVFELEITVCSVPDLLPHEEVIPEHLRDLISAFARSRYQRNPVIVDASSNLILDGTHRWAAMRELGFPLIAACRVDYMSPLVELDTWARVYDWAGADVEKALEGFEVERVDLESVRESDLAVIHRRRAYVVRHEGVRDAFEKLRSLERMLEKLAKRPSAYVPRPSWPLHAHKPLLILPPSPSKTDVLKAAREGYLMPPKSTRHIIPARPVGVNVPLRLLRKRSLDPELFEEVLRQRRLLLLQPPVMLDREYQEVLLMLA